MHKLHLPYITFSGKTTCRKKKYVKRRCYARKKKKSENYFSEDLSDTLANENKKPTTATLYQLLLQIVSFNTLTICGAKTTRCSTWICPTLTWIYQGQNPNTTYSTICKLFLLISYNYTAGEVTFCIDFFFQFTII